MLGVRSGTLSKTTIMPEDFDRNMLSGLVQTGVAISLGAASMSIDMVRNSPDSVINAVAGMKPMFTLPADAGPELQDKARAMAAVWMEKGLGLMSEFKAAGEKFTEGK
jgi:hypothetical protein